MSRDPGPLAHREPAPAFAPEDDMSAPDIAALERRLRAATTPQEGAEAILATLRPFGVEALAAGEIDLRLRGLATFYALPPDAHGRPAPLRLSEVLAEAIEHYARPFTGAELRRDRLSAASPSAALGLQRDHGWADMLVAPTARGAGRYGLMVLLTRRTPTPAAVGALSLCARAGLARLRDLAREGGFAVPPAGLTERERQCLQLVAEGLSDRRIAERLGISEATARSYFEAARLKLKTRTRAHTTARAACLGIVSA